jgi:hypothetical protein
MFKKLRIVVNA